MPRRQQTPRRAPSFASEAEERRFWETHDTSEYADWSSATRVRFPDLKPSTETISLRLPAGLLGDLKALANRRDVPYQSLLKVFLAERVAEEWRALGPRGFAVRESRETYGAEPKKKALPRQKRSRKAGR